MNEITAPETDDAPFHKYPQIARKKLTIKFIVDRTNPMIPMASPPELRWRQDTMIPAIAIGPPRIGISQNIRLNIPSNTDAVRDGGIFAAG